MDSDGDMDPPSTEHAAEQGPASWPMTMMELGGLGVSGGGELLRVLVVLGGPYASRAFVTVSKRDFAARHAPRQRASC